MVFSMRYKILLLLFLLSLAPALSSASTVVLSGSCQTPYAVSNTVMLNFTLRNSGNGTATSIALIPKLYGIASGINVSSEDIGSLYPNNTKITSFNISGLSIPGEYAIGIITSYYQGSSNFFAVFPCTFYFNSKNLTPYVSTLGVNNVKNGINATFFNLAPRSINATAYIIAPPSLHFTPSPINFSISPDKAKNIDFNISKTNLVGLENASYGTGLALSYMYNGRYHTSLLNFVYSSSISKTHSIFSGYFIVYVFFAVFIVLAALIIVSIFYGRKRKQRSQNGK